MMETEFREESLVIAQQLKAHAEGRGDLTAGQFATAWVLANPIISGVIAGPRTLAQFEDYFRRGERRDFGAGRGAGR